jgi:hypothetical protein
VVSRRTRPNARRNANPRRRTSARLPGSNNASSRSYATSSSAWATWYWPSTTAPSQPCTSKPTPLSTGDPGASHPGDDPVDVERRLADRDDRARRDERAQLRDAQVQVGLDRHGVDVDEQVGGVAVELGPLVVLDGVLDRQRVQVELLDHDAEVGGVRVVEVQPHDGVRVRVEVLPDPLGGEPLGHEPPRPVQPGAGGAPGWDGGGDAARHRSRPLGVAGRRGRQCGGAVGHSPRVPRRSGVVHLPVRRRGTLSRSQPAGAMVGHVAEVAV